MAACKKCGAETQLYVNSEPICVACDSKREQKKPAKQQEREDDAKAASRHH